MAPLGKKKNAARKRTPVADAARLPAAGASAPSKAAGRSERAPDGIGEHLLAQAAVVIAPALGDQDALELFDARERLAGHKRSGGVDRAVALLFAPDPQRVEVLKAEPQRVHAVVASAARGVL